MSSGRFCDAGHEVVGGNAKVYNDDGVKRVACRQCSFTGVRVNKLSVGDICRNGHPVVGDNAEEYTEGGSVYVRCGECFAYRNTLKNNPGLTREQFSALRKEGKVNGHGKIKSESKTSVSYATLNYLKLSKRAKRAWEPLEKAFDQTRGLCYNNSEDFIDYEDEFTPTPVEAYKMCEGCPILVECGRFANAYKPIIGVWAGQVWVNGKVVR